MLSHVRRVLALFVVLGWAVGCSDLGAPVRLLPRAEVSVSSLDFGTLAVGDSAERACTVLNSGDGPLAATATVSCADFRIQAGGGAFELAPGGTHTIDVVYRASGVGSATCALEFGGAIPGIPLSGGGALQSPGAAVDLSDRALSFSSVGVLLSSRGSFRIRSVGRAAVRVDVRASCPGFEVVSGGGAGQIPPGDSLTVTVSFAPTSAGHHTCTLSTGPGLPEVALSGDARPVTFEGDLQLILDAHNCADCHDFNRAADLVDAPSIYGYAPARLVVPYDLDASVFYAKVANTHRFGPIMPPPNTFPSLTAAEVATVRAWIQSGAASR